MTRNFNIVAAFIIVTASLAGGLSARSAHRRVAHVNASSAKQASAAEKYEANKIENDYREAITTVEEKYAGEVDYEKVTQAAMQGMLFTLDPHSVYFPAIE